MKKPTPYLLLIFILIVGVQHSYSQEKENFFKKLRLETNLNITNKKRSYSVYSGDKYVTTRYFVGSDYALRYKNKKADFGIEYFSPYHHWNVSVGYRGIKIVRGNPDFKLIPDAKLGYSPLLNKIYYGFGTTLHIRWFTIGYNRILHIKSGGSKYHGDGLNCFRMGIIFRIPWDD